MTHWARGAPALRKLLGSRLQDVRDQSTGTFDRWLERHLRAWSVDPVFQQRTRIREIRRENPILQLLERERHAARAEYEASDGYQLMEQRRRELAGGENAVSGLEHALGRATDEVERSRLLGSLESYQSTVIRLRDELNGLREESVEWQTLHTVAGRLAQARMETGFDREAGRLAELQRNHGRLSGRSGSAFEIVAAEAVRTEILADLARYHDPGALRVLRGVRLGSARAEFDYLVIRLPAGAGAPVDVLAAVEAKRNPNDLAHCLKHRIDNLSWFAGIEGGYDPDAYRTSSFVAGHFDRPATHVEKNGERYLFSRESFALFSEMSSRPDGGVHLPGGLYLVSRPGWLWGIGSGGMARLAHRVSSDVEFDLRDPDYLGSLLEWTKRLTHAVETPDLLRGLLPNEEGAMRVLLAVED